MCADLHVYSIVKLYSSILKLLLLANLLHYKQYKSYLKLYYCVAKNEQVRVYAHTLLLSVNLYPAK